MSSAPRKIEYPVINLPFFDRPVFFPNILQDLRSNFVEKKERAREVLIALSRALINEARTDITLGKVERVSECAGDGLCKFGSRTIIDDRNATWLVMQQEDFEHSGESNGTYYGVQGPDKICISAYIPPNEHRPTELHVVSTDRRQTPQALKIELPQSAKANEPVMVSYH